MPEARDRPTPVPSLQGVRSYSPPKPLCPVDLRLDGNEGMDPPAELLARLPEAGPGVLRHYPNSASFEALLAKQWKVQPAQVLVTAGGDDALYRAFMAMLCPGREIILPIPTFEMLPRYAAFSGATVQTVPWPGGDFPIDAVVRALTDRTYLVCVVSPNNPTGAVAKASDLERISAAAPGALLVADLAYEEFADEALMDTVLRLPNAIAMRTMSKAWGLAGLRVGYAIGPQEIIGWLRACGNPYSVSTPSLWFATERLAHPQQDVERFIAAVKRERSSLHDLLEGLGQAPQPSQGNFVLAKFHDATWVRDALAGLGISVRLFAGRPELEGMLRITCPGVDSDFARLSHGVKTALSPEALLFDLDGVLADVSGSYRAAIVATAEQYGVHLDAETIGAAKAAGDSNNDWVVTRRLLAERGVQATLEEVTVRFERLYQGAAGQPGLREAESLICDEATLARIASRLPIAVVTGRPRVDAQRFLDKHGIARHLSALVCMEDAPLKPDPAPVRLALEKLGIDRAWMIGDSPDDMRAAKAARVVPIGIVSPGDRYERVAPALGSAGASRVLNDIRQLEELLP